MYLHEQFVPDTDLKAYETVLAEFGQCLVNAAVVLFRTHEKVMPLAHARGGSHHATVFCLVRHICESVDGMAVLATQGCPQPAKPALRSALEAYLGLLYILDADTARRGLAYQVAHIHRQIGFYRSVDASTPEGQKTRTLLEADTLHFVPPPVDSKPLVARLERVLVQPEYVPIEAEWQTLQKRIRHLNWFTLFNGPASVRQLAIRLRSFGLYHFLYGQFSNFVHAGDGLRSYGPSDQLGHVSIRPIRHPEGLQSLLPTAMGLCEDAARRLLDSYGTPELKQEFEEIRRAKLKPKYDWLGEKEYLNVPWR